MLSISKDLLCLPCKAIVFTNMLLLLYFLFKDIPIYSTITSFNEISKFDKWTWCLKYTNICLVIYCRSYK